RSTAGDQQQQQQQHEVEK
ncbi:hypothetical protein AWZ03_014970, partial [Drosophila navojoa]